MPTTPMHTMLDGVFEYGRKFTHWGIVLDYLLRRVVSRLCWI